MKTISLSLNQSALIDDSDFDRLNRFSWYVKKGSNSMYAATGNSEKGEQKNMTDVLMGNPPPGFVWDHINRNSLDNRRENLRLATPSQNSCNRKMRSDNTVGHKNIRVETRGTRLPYRVMITKEGKTYSKSFSQLDEALAWRDRRLKELHGDFARAE